MLATHALLDPGDEVLSPDPYYVAYPPCVVLAGGKLVPVPTSWRTTSASTAADIEERITDRTKAILLGYPSNPTGAQMTREDLAEIADVAARRDLIVISDEIYDRLTYGIPHTCFASLPGMKERTVLLGGFSKAYAMTGWRVGWVCAPADILEAMMKIHQYVIMSAPTPSQYAALEAIKNGEEYVAEASSRSLTRAGRSWCRGCARWASTTFEPKGAFYAFPSIRSTGLDGHGVRRAAAGRGEGGRDPGFGLRRVRPRPRADVLRHAARTAGRSDGTHRPVRGQTPALRISRLKGLQPAPSRIRTIGSHEVASRMASGVNRRLASDSPTGDRARRGWRSDRGRARNAGDAVTLVWRRGRGSGCSPKRVNGGCDREPATVSVSYHSRFRLSYSDAVITSKRNPSKNDSTHHSSGGARTRVRHALPRDYRGSSRGPPTIRVSLNSR